MKLALLLLTGTALGQSGPSYDNAQPIVMLTSATGAGPYVPAATSGTGGVSFDNAPSALMLGYNSTTNRYYVCGAANPCTGAGGGGGGGGVSSFNTRTGAVAPAANDYSFSQISGTSLPSAVIAAPGLSPLFDPSGAAASYAGIPTYYVDNVGGSDSNNGLTKAAPFATIAKINALALTAGQTVALKSSDEWHEMLTVTQSGSANAPISFTSYGSGALPIISAADFVTGWTQGTGTSASDCSNGTSLFCSGFETGGSTFTDWTGGVTTNSNSTTTQVTTSPNSGTYAALVSTTDGTDGRTSLLSPSFTAAVSGNTYGFRFYIKPMANAIKTSNNIYFFQLYAGATNNLGCQLYANASAVPYQISCYDFTDSTYPIPATAVTLNVGAWNEIEVDLTASSSGGGKLFVNLSQAGSTTTGVNTSGLIGTTKFGIGNYSYGSLQAGAQIYFDDVRVQSTTPVGAVALTGAASYTWAHAQSTDPKLINFGGQAGTKVSALSAVNTPNTFYWDGSTNLYVYSLLNPAGVVEVPARSYAVTSAGTSYVTFNGLEFRGAQVDDVYCGPSNGCPNWTFNGDTFNDSYASELFMQTSEGVAASGPTVINSTFKGGGASGIGLTNTASTGAYIARNQFYDLAKVYNSSFTDNTYADAVKTFSQNAVDGTGSYIGYNFVHDIGVGQSQNYGGGIHPDTVIGTLVEHNTVTNTAGAGIQLEKGSGNTAQYNLIFNAGTLQYLSGLQVRAGDGLNVANSTVQFNTVSGGYWPCNMQIQQNSGAVTATGIAWKNNICVNSSSNTQFYLDSGFNGTGDAYTNNSFGAASSYMVNAAGTFYATYASLPTPITGSIAGDPLFVSTGSQNYQLQVTSPALGVGAFPVYKPTFTTFSGPTP